MTFEMAFVLGLTLITLILFTLDRLRMDQVAMIVPVSLVLVGILSPAEAVSGLSSEATVTVAGMLVLGLGLRKTGAVNAVARWVRTARLGRPSSRLLIMCLIVAALSPFLNNTAVVVVFLPVFVAMAEQAGEPVSLYLIPLSFVAILGGTVTLIGTSTNLVVYGMATERGLDGLSLFSIAPLGLIYLLVGLIYLSTVGRRLIPRRERPPDLSGRYDMRRFVTELQVRPDSPAIGQTLGDLGWGESYRVSVLGIERGGKDIPAPGARRYIQKGDVLYVQGVANRLLELANRQRLSTPTVITRRSEMPGERGRLVEILVAPGSPLAGHTLSDLRFAQRYDATVVAVQHHDITMHERLPQVEFQVGDVLLVHGPASALTALAEDPGFILLGEIHPPVASRPRAAVAVAIMASVAIAAGTGVLGILPAALGGVALMVFSGCVRLDEVYEELDWMVVFLLAGLIPLGLALDRSGASDLFGQALAGLTGGMSPTMTVAVFYVCTSLLTSAISNTAAAVVLTPVALSAAGGLGMNPYALIVAVMFGASASFLTPFGYQTNVMIYTPGGYRFSDFIRVGGPLNLLLLITAALFIPIFWPS